jgi:hypothetical protein
MYTPNTYKDIPIIRTTGPKLNTSGITMIKCYMYKNPYVLQIANQCSNPIILANSEKEYEFFEANTEHDVIYANQNAFINEDRFVIQPEVEKKYDLVLNACFRDYKNISFAENIASTIHVGYKNGPKLEYLPSFGTLANFPLNSTDMNDYRWICTKELVQIYNSARCGGIFSIKEGSCYTSNEYMLCGLPVISPPCVGGREIYYNPQTSILCNPSKEGVQAAHAEFMRNKHMYDGIKIRESTLAIMEGFRNKLTDFVKDKLEDKFKITVERADLYELLKHSDNSNDS